MRITLVCLVALLAAVPVAAQKVYVDFDRNADFESYKSYAWLPSEGTSVADTDTLMHTRIQNEIELALSTNLARVSENPDLLVTYHTNEKEELQLSTTSMGYGYGAGWGWSPYWGGAYGGGMSTTTASTYTRGTLIIDIIDAKQKNVIWRGSAEATVPSNPRKGEKLISKAIAKITKKWQKEYAKIK